MGNGCVRGLRTSSRIEYCDVRLVLNAETARYEEEGKLPWLHGEVRRELHQVFACKKKGKRPAVAVPISEGGRVVCKARKEAKACWVVGMCLAALQAEISAH